MDALYHQVAEKWKKIGICFRIPKENWQASQGHYQHDPHRCLVKMLETWLERVDPPTTWATIIEAVEFLGEEQLGKELRENYTVN